MSAVSALCAILVVWSQRLDFYRAFRSTAEFFGTLSLRRDLKLHRYTFLSALIVLLSAGAADAQRSGERPMRHVVDELSRIDTNRALELQIIKGTNTNEVLEAIHKQVIEDFRDLQALNNKMMATAWSQPEVDYKYISKMVGEIGKKATRLKTNLKLPQSEPQSDEKKEPAKPSPEISNSEEFKAELLLLDKSVMSFVNNPIFQKTSVVDLRLVDQANLDLEAVIEKTNKLKKVSEKLKH